MHESGPARRELSQHTTRVLAVCHVTSSHNVDDMRIYERECRALADHPGFRVLLVGPGRVPDHGSITHVRTGAAPRNRLSRWTLAIPRAMRPLLSTQADVYHFHDPELIPLAWVLAISGKRVVWDAHEDYEGRFASVEGSGRWSKRGLSKRMTHRVIDAIDKKASGVIAASQTIASRYSNPRVQIVGNEARIRDFEEARPSFGERRGLFTGSPESGHLFPEILRAIEGTPDLRLTVVGGRETPEMRRFAHEILGDRVEFLGRQSPEGLVEQMSRCSFGLCTYAPTPAYMDPTGSPTKFYEFAAGGLPIVGSPIPTITTRLNESMAGRLAVDFTARGLSEAIREVTSDEDEWEKMSRTARAWSRQNDRWAESEAALMALYSELAEERTTP